jgi:hypothetical protein
MLTYRLAGTTEHSGSTTTNHPSIRPTSANRNGQTRRIFTRHGAPSEAGAALLT